SVTLADVLLHIRGHGGLPSSGAELVATRARGGSDTLSGDKVTGSSVTLSPGHPATLSSSKPTLSRMSYVEAVLWVGARLAEALAHAHQRGVIHGDIKPANVLMSEDGQPLLLDFNLALDTTAPAGVTAARVGGTLPYMAPEQMEALRDRRPLAD